MTQTASIIDKDRVMDVRPIPCSIKHGLILKNWFNLAVGEHFILLNDHDPVPLRYQFEAEFPGAFTWEYVARGPEEFRVRITKLAAWVPSSWKALAAGGEHLNGQGLRPARAKMTVRLPRGR